MIYLVIAGMAIVTLLPRIVPVGFFADRALPAWIERWLRFVPIAILSAMLAIEVLSRDGRLDAGLANPRVPATLAAGAAAFLTRSLFATVFVGMAAVALLRAYA